MLVTSEKLMCISRVHTRVLACQGFARSKITAKFWRVHLKLCESCEYPLTGIKGANLSKMHLVSYNSYGKVDTPKCFYHHSNWKRSKLSNRIVSTLVLLKLASTNSIQLYIKVYDQYSYSYPWCVCTIEE